MTTSTTQGKYGIQCRAWIRLGDSNFTDDLLLLYHTHEQMQMKTVSVAAASEALGLSIHRGKSMILKNNTERTNTTTIDGEIL
ncbi:unnamed protein product [Schistosoma margrebowiei]|uniref:Uncharacterized protein n=1 Tax=Schistosoma margrebowiei TaxID=48269 RepID=A0A183M7C2_9TREM|nr:unnamed protein product [Schistosoma margrebowiei]